MIISESNHYLNYMIFFKATKNDMDFFYKEIPLDSILIYFTEFLYFIYIKLEV